VENPSAQSAPADVSSAAIEGAVEEAQPVEDEHELPRFLHARAALSPRESRQAFGNGLKKRGVRRFQTGRSECAARRPSPADDSPHRSACGTAATLANYRRLLDRQECALASER